MYCVSQLARRIAVAFGLENRYSSVTIDAV